MGTKTLSFFKHHPVPLQPLQAHGIGSGQIGYRPISRARSEAENSPSDRELHNAQK
jgi:hypothetical protein